MNQAAPTVFVVDDDPSVLRALQRLLQSAGWQAQTFGSPEEFGALCAFVCSSHAGYLTGQNLLIDGGAIRSSQ